MSTQVRTDEASSRTDFGSSARRAFDRGSTASLQVGEHKLDLTGSQLHDILHLLAESDAGRPVAITVIPEVLTTGQAADLLGVTRPTVVALIDRGELAATRVGSHRRLDSRDVIDFRNRAALGRRKALDELVDLSEDLRLYR